MRNIKKTGAAADRFVLFKNRGVVERDFPIPEKAELSTPRGVPGMNKKMTDGLRLSHFEGFIIGKSENKAKRKCGSEVGREPVARGSQRFLQKSLRGQDLFVVRFASAEPAQHA